MLEYMFRALALSAIFYPIRENVRFGVMLTFQHMWNTVRYLCKYIFCNSPPPREKWYIKSCTRSTKLYDAVPKELSF